MKAPEALFVTHSVLQTRHLPMLGRWSVSACRRGARCPASPGSGPRRSARRTACAAVVLVQLLFVAVHHLGGGRRGNGRQAGQCRSGAGLNWNHPARARPLPKPCSAFAQPCASTSRTAASWRRDTARGSGTPVRRTAQPSPLSSGSAGSEYRSSARMAWRATSALR